VSTRALRHRTILAAVAVVAGAAAATAAVPAAAHPGTPTGTVAQVAAVPAAQAQRLAAPVCMDPVVYTLNASAVRKTLDTVCIAVGGVLRIANLGPEGLTTVTPAGRADCYYEGGVHSCRLIGTGTVRFGVTNAQGTRQQTVTVSAEATKPRLPDACLNAEIVTRDADEGGMPWSAICMHLNTPLRFTNLGSAIFNVNPADSVDCWEAEDGFYCMPNRTGTVTFTITKPDVEDLVQTVVFVA
jgi:hypothetical protein